MPSATAASPPVAPSPAPAAEKPVADAVPPAASPSSLLRVAAPSVPAPAERMVASLNPQLGPASAGAAAAAVTSVVRFGPGLADIPADARPVLDAIVARLKANDALRVQLIAHAAGGEDDAIDARRLSLARAVAVRAYLIEGGVRSLRMDVRALGNRPDGGGPTDRVDLVIVDQ
jgi:outer membrane protein OmpA-like peptidoglycan-associated protein